MNSRVSLPAIVLFAAGLASAIRVNFVGTLYGADVVLTIALVVVLLRRRGPALPGLRPFLILGFLWLAGAIATDVIRQTPPQDYLRGWAKIGFLLVSLSAVWLVSAGHTARLMAYFAGLSIATIISTIFFPTEYQAAVSWKFGYATPLALIACIAASRFRPVTPQGIAGRFGIPLGLGVVNLALNFRSMFAILLAAAGTTAVADFFGALSQRRRIATPAFALIFFASATLIAVTISSGYSQLAQSGALGRDAQAKYHSQSQGDLGVMLGGRSESLASIQAIKDSPFIGHGSWAKDRYYVALRILALRQHGMVLNAVGSDAELIPSHSYFFGSWVEAGILGAIFWIYCFLRSGQALVSLIDARSRAAPFLSFLMIQLIWNIPFSPFGADVRFYVAGELCAIGWIANVVAQAGRINLQANRKYGFAI